MRIRFLLLALPALITACGDKTNGPVRLDFIGTAALVSGNRLANPNDTLSTRAYAVGNDNRLKRLLITVKYEPTKNPIVYPLPLTAYDPTDTPDDEELVYLDSLITPVETGAANAPRGGEYVFQNRFTARSTSGTELWRYTVTDATGQSASRAYRLTVRNPDSTAVFHSYTALIRPVPSTVTTPDSVRLPAQARARVFLNLRSGLLLPKYALVNQDASVQANQQLIDLICAANSTAISLNTPTNNSVVNLSLQAWPPANRRATELRRTAFTITQFNGAVTTDAFVAAFTGGSSFAPDSSSTGALAKDQVIAFRTSESGQTTYNGLLLVTDVAAGTAPLLKCSVKVQK
ncbi:hypothetical protein [Hymenobacter sp.]|uniref:hypothetical protein n=1 Tax=Hymenobacter sp. TaxID=1898978 RepID=UPI00286BF125|nr:hypothetical protein [Hymenobacter sp.]